MKLFVANVFFFTSLFFVSSAFGQTTTRCMCKPSPPGGTTTCNGQIAFCLVRNGVCNGKCINPKTNPKTNPSGYAAELFSIIFQKEISSQDLKKDSEEARDVISKILQSNGETLVLLKFNESKIEITIGLTKESKSALKKAYNQLAKK
jgi:hypothetical protein